MEKQSSLDLSDIKTRGKERIKLVGRIAFLIKKEIGKAVGCNQIDKGLYS